MDSAVLAQTLRAGKHHAATLADPVHPAAADLLPPTPPLPPPPLAFTAAGRGKHLAGAAAAVVGGAAPAALCDLRPPQAAGAAHHRGWVGIFWPLGLDRPHRCCQLPPPPQAACTLTVAPPPACRRAAAACRRDGRRAPHDGQGVAGADPGADRAVLRAGRQRQRQRVDGGAGGGPGPARLRHTPARCALWLCSCVSGRWVREVAAFSRGRWAQFEYKLQMPGMSRRGIRRIEWRPLPPPPPPPPAAPLQRWRS